MGLDGFRKVILPSSWKDFLRVCRDHYRISQSKKRFTTTVLKDWLHWTGEKDVKEIE
jgi:hypothetical protein